MNNDNAVYIETSQMNVIAFRIKVGLQLQCAYIQTFYMLYLIKVKTEYL